MRGRRATNAVLIVLAMLGISCGPVNRVSNSPPEPTAGQSQAPPGAPTPDPGGPTFLTVVLRPGADPMTVGHRIGGPDVVIHQVPQVRQENLPQAMLRRTYRVDLVKGHELESLGRGRSDPEVMRAYFGEYPGQYPKP